MSNDIYNGNSEGFQYLTNGYMDYSREVIARRAIPDLRDGMKPVHRRILYSSYKAKLFNLQKCSAIVAEALKLHPHGDAATYGSFALLTESNASWNMPLYHGVGNLGHVYSSAPPAAMRYPKACLNDHAKDFFKDIEVMEMMPAEEGDGEEPVVLNSIYPNVLVNGSLGIAVSVGTRIPSFNLSDVLDMTCRYITNGKLEVTDIIYPDFPTGGILVKSDSEVAKIMATGTGRIKIRAKVEIEGKEIIVREVPVGKTFEGVAKAAQESDIRDIASVMNLTDKNNGGCVSIVCKTKRSVEGVLLELYRRNILQSIFASNILVTLNGEPFMLGVHGVIAKWVDWRKGILVKKFNNAIAGLEEEIRTLGYFLSLIQNQEWRDTYVDKMVHSKTAKSDCTSYLKELFKDIPQSVCDWIYDRQGNAFNNGGRYSRRYADLLSTKNGYEYNLHHLDEYIINELNDLKKRYSGSTQRKTDISNIDYRFSKISDADEIVDTSECVYTLFKSGFLKKTRQRIEEEGILCQFDSTASSLLVGFDNYGRIIRFLGSDIDFTSVGENGVYMPKFLEAAFQEDYKLLYLGNCDGKMRMLVYRDGYVGFLDTNEFVGKKVIKYTSHGVDLAVKDKLLEIYEEEAIPQCLLLADDTGKHIKLAAINVKDIPVRSRTSRAKIVSGTGINTKYIRGCSYMMAMSYIKNINNFMGKLKVVKDEDFLGDPALMEDGKYLELCTDFG